MLQSGVPRAPYRGTAHKRTRVSRPQSNGIVARLHRTLLDEQFLVEGRRAWFEAVAEMQVALNATLVTYNTERPHLGYRSIGRRPIDTVMQSVNQEG